MGQDVVGQNFVGQDVAGAISLGQEVSGAGGSGAGSRESCLRDASRRKKKRGPSSSERQPLADTLQTKPA